MGLQAIYERFLQSPNAQNLADDATLQYVTTLTSFSKQDRIIKHFDDQDRNVVKKKVQKVISAVEGLTSVAVIVETSLQFISSGGAYLPGQDTFILDRTVTLPVVCTCQTVKDIDLADPSRSISYTSTRMTRSLRFDSVGTRETFSNRSKSLVQEARIGPYMMARIKLR